MAGNKKRASEKLNYPAVLYVQRDNLIRINFHLSDPQMYITNRHLETSQRVYDGFGNILKILSKPSMITARQLSQLANSYIYDLKRLH